jgi:chromosome segregation ATPase
MYLRNLGLLIENKKQSNSEILTQLFWFSNADTRQREIDNKLKVNTDKELADRKVKEDLDAKAAADLKSKQDAAVNALEQQLRVLSESVGGLQDQVSQLNSQLTAALASLKSANAKIKKICAAKPKPKGC